MMTKYAHLGVDWRILCPDFNGGDVMKRFQLFLISYFYWHRFSFFLFIHSRSISWNVELFSPEDWLGCCWPLAWSAADPPPPVPVLDWLEDEPETDVEVEDEVVVDEDDEEVLLEVVVAVAAAWGWGPCCWLGTLKKKCKQIWLLFVF